MALSNDDIARSLYKACSDGNYQELVKLVDTHTYVMSLLDMTNRRDPPKAVVEKTIYNASLKGHYRVVKELLNCNVNPNCKCDLGTPIYAAVVADCLDVVKLLVDRGAEYRRVVGGFSPVFASCVEGRMKILRYLVNAGADLRFIKNPPLVFTACMQGHLEVLKYLMDETEFDVNWTINEEDSARVDGKDTLLYVAASSKKLEVADYLLQQGALVTQAIITRFPDFIKELLVKRTKQSSHQKDADGEPLVSARWKELGMTELPWSFLSSFNTRLTKLELRGNRLSTLPEEIFQMPNLKVLDVSQNMLPELSQEVVPWNCSSLTELDACRNQISYAPGGLFLLPNLTSLNLSYNLLQRLPGDSEDACPNIVWRCDLLKKMDLSHNRLRTLPDTFKNLRRLNAFTVSYNHLHSLPSSMGLGCINLVHLDAAHNSLKELPYGSASYWMHCLERLYLSHNEFEEISRNITELSHLTTLDLSHNHIQYLPLTMSWTNSRMSKLSLAYNNLTTLTHALEEEQTYSRSGSHAINKEKEGERRNRGFTTFTMFKKKTKAKIASPSAVANVPDANPRELPFETWSNTLQSLYLQNNNIQFLPNYLGNFTSMARLDVSQNTSVHCLPLTFGRLKNCWELIMHGLDITNVPKHLIPGVGRGASTKQLIAYLKAQMKKAEPYTRMKLMAVGLQGRGKTTLLSVLRDPGTALPPNVSTVGVSVHKWTVRAPRGRNLSQRQQMDVTFSMWDLAGQEVYYATHQCFLSRNTLYLVVWNMTEGEQGIDYLRPWLLNVQARAPYSPIIVVGTHLDKIPPAQVAELRHMYRSRILKSYDAQGYPTISDVCMVSCVTKEGIRDLQDRIHAAALNAKDPDTHEHVIGMQVPRSYCVLQNFVEEEARRLKEVGQPPVLNQKEFATLAEKTEDITDPEELTLAAQFLHDNGVILHYNDHLKGLNNLYFIDPVWLADMLAHIITVPQKHSFVQNGILVEARLKFIFHGHRDYPEQYLQQYMQLLERFEIALSLGQGTLLIPSMLPEQRPALPFAMPLPSTKRLHNTEPRSVSKSSLTRVSVPSSSEEEGGKGEEKDDDDDESLTKMIDGKVVVNVKINCVRRRYKMAYIPSGFWSRLISRLMINLKRSGLVDSRSSCLSDPNMIYWRRGILIIYPSGRFLVEAIQAPLPGVSTNDTLLTSVKFLGAGIDKKAQQVHGVDITVWSNNDDFSAIGYVVDQLDSLIDEWFPGLNDLDIDGEWLVERQALWVVPPELKESLTSDAPDPSDCFYDPLNQEVYVFKLEDCALKALQQDTIYCADYDVHVPLSSLVPDLLMTDLPPNLIIDQSVFEFNPKDLSTRLGRGGAGAVYIGRYRREQVAVKEFLTQSQAEAFQDEEEMPPGGPYTYHEDDNISSGEALFLYRDMRQEVTVLAQLSHPNIVSILGVSLRPMCIALELAPMGSLFGILDKKLEAIKAAQADLPTANIKMPGGVLGHEISARIALQVALATRYLHKVGIVYRDLKSDNVLIWSLDVNVSNGVNAKLADYGISRFANPGGIKGEEGTPGYMAPEAIKRRGEDQAFDEKVDIFSFGMLLFELITGQRPFESMSTGQEVNRAVIQRERPQVQEGNIEPCFPGMIELMEDCWRHLAAERPTADEVVQRISTPGFLCRRHTVSRVQQHPLQKIDTIYCQPVINKSTTICTTEHYNLWTWSRQDTERNFSLFNVEKGFFTLPEKPSSGGRVFAMATTGDVEKRLWVATSVSRNFPDFEIQVFSYKNPVEPPVYLWSFIVRDSVLDMTTEVEGGRVKRVFASLANGTICVFSRVSISSPQPTEVGDAQVIPEACILKCEDDRYRPEAEDWGQPLIITLSEAARGMSIKYMTFVGKDHLWCGCGNSISVINVVDMKVVTSIPVFTRRAQLINELVSNGTKVWGIGRQLANVIEWDAKTFALNCVFDCSRVDPTGNTLIGVPSREEFVLPDSMISTVPKDSDKSPSVSPQDQLESSTSSLTSGSPHNDSGFEVSNEPENPSKMPYATYNARFSRRTLRDIKPRERAMNMSHQDGRSIFAPRPEFDALKKAQIRSMLRQQGATRVTSLLLAHDTLWIARGMGDVLIVDIGGGKTHGLAIARLATEDSNKYGNRSNHKLCLVGNEYVVSSQWLEPLDMPRPRAQTDSTQLGMFADQNEATAHQQLTVWCAWSNEVIRGQAQKVAEMIEMDSQAVTEIDS